MVVATDLHNGLMETVRDPSCPGKSLTDPEAQASVSELVVEELDPWERYPCPVISIRVAAGRSDLQRVQHHPSFCGVVAEQPHPRRGVLVHARGRLEPVEFEKTFADNALWCVRGEGTHTQQDTRCRRDFFLYICNRDVVVSSDVHVCG